MIVSVLNTKGGVGKTTTAINLAVACALAGGDVLAVDGDSQGSLIAALANREVQPPIAAAHYCEGSILRQQVGLAKDRYQHIVIDAGGRDNSALRAALVLSDVVLVPFQPRSFDVWALEDMAQLIEEAKSVRDFKAYAFLAMADPLGTDNAEAADSVPANLEFLNAPIGKRKAIANAAAMGQSVLETGRDEKAMMEIQRLFNSVFI